MERPSVSESYAPLSAEQLEHPYTFYERARKEEPIFFNPYVRAYVVTRYEDILTVLKQPEIFSSKNTLQPLVEFTPAVFGVLAQGYPQVPVMINSDGPDHRRFREPVNKVLAPARLKSFEPFIRERAEALIASFIDTGQAEIISQFAYPLPLEVILHVFGIPTADMERCKHWSDELLALTSSPLEPERQVECAQSYVEFQHYFARLVAERRKAPTNDLISEMITTQVAGQEPLTDVELINALTGILLAGHETVTNAIGNGLALLLQTPARWQQLCAQPELMEQTIEEILRFDSPAQAFFRVANQEVTLGGVTLPKDAQLLLVYGSANRDEEHFPQADQFDMQREPNRHLAFGYGAHFCVGAFLARVEGRIALETLCQRLPHLRLVPQQELTHVPTLMFRGYSRLEVAWG